MSWISITRVKCWKPAAGFRLVTQIQCLWAHGFIYCDILIFLLLLEHGEGRDTHGRSRLRGIPRGPSAGADLYDVLRGYFHQSCGSEAAALPGALQSAPLPPSCCSTPNFSPLKLERPSPGLCGSRAGPRIYLEEALSEDMQWAWALLHRTGSLPVLCLQFAVICCTILLSYWGCSIPFAPCFAQHDPCVHPAPGTWAPFTCRLLPCWSSIGWKWRPGGKIQLQKWLLLHIVCSRVTAGLLVCVLLFFFLSGYNSTRLTKVFLTLLKVWFKSWTWTFGEAAGRWGCY